VELEKETIIFAQKQNLLVYKTNPSIKEENWGQTIHHTCDENDFKMA